MNDTSTERMAANRANAQKSTGPKTPEGMAASRMNALKHGLRSKEALIYCHTYQENAELYAAVHERFMTDLRPVGLLEEALVDQIASTHWRLRRVLLAEAGEIGQSIDKSEESQHNYVELQKRTAIWGLADDPAMFMEESSKGCLTMRQILADVRTAVERDGELTDATMAELAQRFYGKPCQPVKDLECFRIPIEPEVDPDTRAKMQKVTKEGILTYLDLWMEEFARKAAEHKKREAVTDASRMTASFLPKAEVLAKIQRYEAQLNRQFYRAIKELRALQKERREMEYGNWRSEPRRQKPQSDVPRVLERNPWAPNPEPSKVPNEPIAGDSRAQTSEKKAIPLSEYGGVLSREQLRELVQMEREKGTLPPLEDAKTVAPPLDTAEKLPNEPTGQK